MAVLGHRRESAVRRRRWSEAHLVPHRRRISALRVPITASFGLQGLRPSKPATMRRSKNLMGFRSLFASSSTSSPYFSSSLSAAALSSPPFGSPSSYFRLSNGTSSHVGLYGNGGLVPNGGSLSAMGLDPHSGTITCSARAVLVGLLTAFALINLYVAGQGRDDGSTGTLAMLGAGAAATFGLSSSPGGSHHVRGVTLRESWITSTSQPFNMNGLAKAAKRLIVVAGHSVTVSGHLEDAGLDEHDWYLLEYQKNKGLPQAILGHIRAGIRAAASDPSSLLVMSGGQTRAMTGPDSEGASYYRVADAMNLWSEASVAGNGVASDSVSLKGKKSLDNTVRARTVSEDFATDSFENLMFSICRFHEVTGSYPESITVVSFTFKQRRFETMHASALQWPSHRLHYVGVDPPASSGFNLEEATKGEKLNAAAPFEEDPYGCHSDVLQAKRKERNPFFRTHPYATSCPDMAQVLSFCGPELISKDQVPWRELWR